MEKIISELLALVEDKSVKVLYGDDVIKGYILGNLDELIEEVREQVWEAYSGMR